MPERSPEGQRPRRFSFVNRSCQTVRTEDRNPGSPIEEDAASFGGSRHYSTLASRIIRHILTASDSAEYRG
jgi:hypothetical protein